MTASSSSAPHPGAQGHLSTILSGVLWQGWQSTPSYTQCEGDMGVTLPFESPERVFYIKKGKTSALKCLVQLQLTREELLAPAVEFRRDGRSEAKSPIGFMVKDAIPSSFRQQESCDCRTPVRPLLILLILWLSLCRS